MKHFRATHKETGETVEFNLEDIYSDGFVSYYPSGYLYFAKLDFPTSGEYSEEFHEWEQKEGKYNRSERKYINRYDLGSWNFRDWLQYYDLEYMHKGEWFKYEKP